MAPVCSSAFAASLFRAALRAQFIDAETLALLRNAADGSDEVRKVVSLLLQELRCAAEDTVVVTVSNMAGNVLADSVQCRADTTLHSLRQRFDSVDTRQARGSRLGKLPGLP